MNIYPIFVHIHSGLRWLVLIFIIAAIINAGIRLYFKSSSKHRDYAFNKVALIFMHFQALLGLVLYFISPKVIFNTASMRDSVLRFFLVEHIGIMIIAVILLTIGYVKSDRAVAIPWPFRGLGAGWF